MRTARSLTVCHGRSICRGGAYVACIPPCHACPPTMHDPLPCPPTTHAPHHACPRHTCPPATHAPAMYAPLPPHMPPSAPAMHTPPWTEFLSIHNRFFWVCNTHIFKTTDCNITLRILIPVFTVLNSSCGKVMFSQACVKNSVHGGGHAWQGGHVWEGCVCQGACMVGEGVCMAGGMCSRGVCGSGGMYGRGVRGGGMWQGACVVGGGVCMEGGHACQGVCVVGACAWWAVCMAEETATAVDGTHPTGMHSCCYNCFVIIVLLEKDLKQQFLLLRFFTIEI